jgi:uncharacterized membrane protein YozB (DUF420 family)
LPQLADILPHVNASLNSLATVLLVVGYVLIKQRLERAHKTTMLACFGVSVVFLVSYLVYHAIAGSRPFPETAPVLIRRFYYAILITHVVLAAAVPFLAIATIVLGLKDRRAAHRRWAKITFPIWLYVSVTGVIVYVMLYQVFPPLESGGTIP